MELDIPDMFPASPYIRQQRSLRRRPDYPVASRYLHYDGSERLSLPRNLDPLSQALPALTALLKLPGSKRASIGRGNARRLSMVHHGVQMRTVP